MKPEIYEITSEHDLINMMNYYYHYWDRGSNNFYLDLNKDKFDFLEKIIYDLSYYFFKELDIDLDENKHTIEFWGKNGTFAGKNYIHFDKDETIYKKTGEINQPLMTCIIYLNDNIYSTLITELDVNDYKYKKFDEENRLYLSFPKKNTCLCFDGSYLHGMVNIFEELNNIDENDRNVIILNLWDKKIHTLKLYKGDIDLQDTDSSDSDEEMNNIKRNKSKLFDKNEEIISLNKKQCKKILNNDVFNNKFYEDIFFKENYNELFKLKNILFEKLNSKDDYINKINEYNLYQVYTLDKGMLKEEKLEHDINEVNNNNISYKNRFLQRIKKNYNYFSTNTCYWLINEIENHIINNEFVNEKIIFIELEEIKSIFNYLLISLGFIKNEIFNFYNIENRNINISKSIVIKQNEIRDNSIEIIDNNSFFIVNIMLNNNNYDGGNIYFNDNTNLLLNKGDTLITCSRVKYNILNLYSGSQYCILIHLDLID